MADNYKDFMEDISPPWLREKKGARYVRSLGDSIDAMVQPVKQGVKVRFPLIAPRDALAVLGEERGLPKSVAETYEQYASRLQQAWETWPWAGTPTGVLQALYDAGYTEAHLLIKRGRDFSLDGDRHLVTVEMGFELELDRPESFWSVFLLVIPSWDGTPPVDGSDEAEAMKKLVRKWKAAHATMDRIVIVEDGLIWGYPSTQEWGDPGLVWGGETTEWLIGL